MNLRWGLLFIAAIVVMGLFVQWRKPKPQDALEKSVTVEREPSTTSNTEKSKIQTPAKDVTAKPPSEAPAHERSIPKKSFVKAIPLVAPSADHLQNLQLKVVGQKWKWWANTGVVAKKDSSNASNKTLAEVSQHFVVPRSSQGSSPEEFFPDSPLVLFNPLKKSVGLLTGTYVITTKTENDFADLIQDENFEVINSFSHLRLVYLKPRKAPFNLSEVENALTADRRVQSFEYEILKGNLVKN